MKKLFAFLSTVLLFGCFGSGPAGDASSNEETLSSEITEETSAIEEGKFIGISAQILCLPANNSQATPEEIELKAKDLINQAGITQEEFTAYQAEIEKNSEEKQRISTEIMREMDVYCDAEKAMNAGANEAVENSSEETMAPEESIGTGEAAADANSSDDASETAETPSVDATADVPAAETGETAENPASDATTSDGEATPLPATALPE